MENYQVITAQAPVLLGDAAESYLTDCQARGFSAHTLALDRIVFRELGHAVANKPLAEVTPSDLRSFIIAKATRTSQSTAQRYYTVLHAFFRWCVREGLLRESPMANVMKPKVKETLIAPLTTEELELLIRATEGEDFVRVRDRALLLTLIDTGIRTSEACGLSVQDVDWTGRTLRIRNAKGGRERLVPFGEAVANALRKYMLKRATVEEDRLFITAYGEPISRYRLRHIVCGIARRAGIERPVYPHLLRHSAAVEMLRNGASSFHVQRVLGHATLAMTRKYCELLDDDLRQAHAAASPADRLQIARAKNGRRRLR